MELLQVPSELEQMMVLYRNVKPERVLEIGCWDGGTLKEWMTASPPHVLVAVDLEHRNHGAYEDWLHPDTSFYWYADDSKSERAVKMMQSHAPYDWVFIDGDHGDEGVAADVRNCLPLVREGGLMLLHDVQAGTDFGGGDYGPRKELHKLAAEGYETWEWVDPEPMGWAHGIGVVQL